MHFVSLQAVRVPSTKGPIARPIHRERQIIVNVIKHDQRLYRRKAHMFGIIETSELREAPAIPPIVI